MGVDEACEIGLLDGAFGSDADEFLEQLECRAETLAAGSTLPRMLEGKHEQQRRTNAPGRWPATALTS